MDSVSIDNLDDDNDDDDDEGYEKMLKAIDRFSKNADKADFSAVKKYSSIQTAPESAYSSLIDSNSSGITMDALLSALGDTKGLSMVKQQVMVIGAQYTTM